MRLAALAGLLCALGSAACGSSQQSGGDDAGETTAASGSEGAESSTGGGDEPMDCGGITITPEYIPPIVMYVVDTSSSMRASWDHDGDPNTPEQSRWASARELVALTAATIGHEDHPEHGHLGVLGLQRFPSADACPSCTDASACVIAAAPEVALAQQDHTALLAALPEPNAELPGASPAAAAYASALEHVLANSEEDRARYVILLTDGHTNCSADLEPPDSLAAYDEDLHASIETAFFDHSVYTMVIAIDEAADPLESGPDTIPNFDPRPALTALGQAGGVASGYYSASEPDEILQALAGPGEILDCTIDLSWGPEGPPTAEQVDLVTWTIDGEPVPYLEPETCATEDGWTWLEPGQVVTFCGAACDAMKTSGTTIEGTYGCPTER